MTDFHVYVNNTLNVTNRKTQIYNNKPLYQLDKLLMFCKT